MKTKKRILSLVMAVAMCLSLLPMTVLAATPPAKTDVAKIGNNGYATLQAAIDAAENGDTVELISDIEFIDTDVIDVDNNDHVYSIAGNRNITIDGNGHKITAKLTNAKVGKESGAYVFQITSTGTTNFKNLTILCHDNNVGTVKGGLNFADAAGTSTVTNCCIKTSDQHHSNADWNVAAIVINYANVTIDGGEYYGGKNTQAGEDYQGINVDKAGSLNFISGKTNGIKVEGGSATVSGGEHSKEVKAVSPGNLTITGGTFVSNPSTYVDTGSYKVVENGAVWTVSSQSDDAVTLKCGGTVIGNFATIKKAVYAYSGQSNGDYVLIIKNSDTAYGIGDLVVYQVTGKTLTIQAETQNGVTVKYEHDTTAPTSNTIFNIHGNSGGDYALTFSGINFDLGTGTVSAIRAMKGGSGDFDPFFTNCGNGRYAHNITCSYCTFTDTDASGSTVIDAKNNTGAGHFLLDNCTVTKVENLLSDRTANYGTGSDKYGFKISNSTVTGVNRFLNNQAGGATSIVENCTVDSANDYSIRTAKDGTSSTVIISDSTITNNCPTTKATTGGIVVCRQNDTVTITNSVFVKPVGFYDVQNPNSKAITIKAGSHLVKTVGGTSKIGLLSADLTLTASDNGHNFTNPCKINETGVEYATLAEAIAVVENNQTITLLQNITLTEILLISNGKNFTIDLGGKKLTGRVNVSGAYLDLKNGTIDAGTFKQALNAYGTTDSSYNTTDKLFTYIKVEKDVTLTGDYGMCFLSNIDNAYYACAYGVKVDFYGTANAPCGAFVSGNIGATSDSRQGTPMHTAGVNPVFNVYGTLNGTSGGTENSSQGVSLNGYATVNVYDGAIITGAEAIGVKAGCLNVSGGTLTATGPKCDPVAAIISGTDASGGAVAVSSTYNPDSGKIIVNISGGTIESINNAALLVTHAYKNQTAVAFSNGMGVNVSGGYFVGGNGAVFIAPRVEGDDSAYPPVKFITGGVFNTEPELSYLADNYIAVLGGGVYTVNKKDDNSGNFIIEKKDNQGQSAVVITADEGKTPTTEQKTAAEGVIKELTKQNEQEIIPVVSQNVQDATKTEREKAKADAPAGANVTSKLKVELTAVDVTVTTAQSQTTTETNTVVYDVKPIIVTTVAGQDPVEKVISTVDEPITFTLKLPQTFQVGSTVKVTHKLTNGGSEIFYPTVQGEESAPYVTLTATSFSEWEITAANTTDIIVESGQTYDVTGNPEELVNATLKEGGSVLYKIDASNLNLKADDGCVLVTFNYNGGVDAQGGIEYVTAVKPGSSVNAPVLTTKIDGSVFKTWTADPATSSLAEITGATTFTAQWSKDTYQVRLDPADKSVKVDSIVNLNVKVDGTAPWNDAKIVLKYDNTHFTFVNTYTAGDTPVSVEGDTITFTVYGANRVSGDTVKTLSFKANTTAYTAVTENFTFKDTTTVNSGTEAMRIPVTPASQVGAKISVINADAKTFSVTLGNGLSGAPTATEKVAYVATIDNYNAGYDYTVVAKVNGTSISPALTPDTNGKITVPADKVTGPIEITVTKKLKGITVDVSKDAAGKPRDYVAGYLLVKVKSTVAGAKYNYNGAPMYKIDNYTGLSTNEVMYAYLVSTKADEFRGVDMTSYAAVVEAATTKVTTSVSPLVTISHQKDVNADGGTDTNDVQAVWNCYNVSGIYPVGTYMAVYLRADQNCNDLVDYEDLSKILTVVR